MPDVGHHWLANNQLPMPWTVRVSGAGASSMCWQFEKGE